MELINSINYPNGLPPLEILNFSTDNIGGTVVIFIPNNPLNQFITVSRCPIRHIMAMINAIISTIKIKLSHIIIN